MTNKVDIPACELLIREIKNLSKLPKPPNELTDMNKYKDDIEEVFQTAALTVDQVKVYANDIMNKLGEIRKSLTDYSTVVAKAIKEALEQLQANVADTNPSSEDKVERSKRSYAPYEKSLYKLGSTLEKRGNKTPGRKMQIKDKNLEALEKVHALEKLANSLANNRLDELTKETEKCIAKLQDGAQLTETDLADLNGNCKAFVEKTERSFEDQKRFIQEEELRKAKAEKDRLVREEEERMRKENEEKERKEKEARDATEAEQRRLKEEQDKLIREEQERMRKENEEKERKELEAKQKIEAERKRREDPNNWAFFRYDCTTEGWHDTSMELKRGVCVFTSIDGNLDKDDIKCTMRDSQCVANELDPGETLASQLFCLQPKNGRMEFEVAARVYVNYAADVNNTNEVCVKLSINDGQWITAKSLDLTKNIVITDRALNFTGVELNDFSVAKLVVVVRAKCNHLTVGKKGGTIQSQTNNKIRLNVPRNTFDDPAHITFVTSSDLFEDRIASINSTLKENRVSTSNHVINVNSDQTTKSNLQINLPAHDENSSDVVYRLVSSTNPDEWNLADIEKGSDGIGSITISLPPGSDKYKYVEISVPKKFSKEDAIAAADTVYDHANRTAVVILFHQFNNEPKRARIQCVRHDRVGNAIQQMSYDGYTFGAQTSCVFHLRDGQEIQFFFSGNIARDSDEEGLLKMLFFSNFRQTVQDVNLAIVNDFKQAGLSEYRGTLTCHIMEPGDLKSADRRTEYTVTLKTSLPKPVMQDVHDVGLPFYMKSLTAFLASQLTTSKTIGWRVIVKSITGELLFNSLNRRAIQIPGDEGKCAYVLYEWMKESIGLVLDDADGKSPDEQLFGIIVGKLNEHKLTHIEKRCVDFIHTLKDKLSDGQLSELVSEWNGDIYAAGGKLGFARSKIKNCLVGVQREPRHQLLALLKEWRMSWKAVEAGTDAIQVLKSTLDL